jgi:hypothetical protein
MVDYGDRRWLSLIVSRVTQEEAITLP